MSDVTPKLFKTSAMSILFYKKPKSAFECNGPLDISNVQTFLEKAEQCKAAIPPQLSFEKVVSNNAAPVS